MWENEVDSYVHLPTVGGMEFVVHEMTHPVAVAGTVSRIRESVSEMDENQTVVVVGVRIRLRASFVANVKTIQLTDKTSCYFASAYPRPSHKRVEAGEERSDEAEERVRSLALRSLLS